MRRTGFTLLECLIALIITSFLVTAFFRNYLNVKNHFNEREGIETLTEESQIIHSLLETDLQGTGFSGCMQWDNHSPVYDNIQKKWLTSPLSVRNADDPDLPKNIRERVKPETQVIEIREMDFFLDTLSNTASFGSTHVMLNENENSSLKSNNFVMIADCLHAEVNRIIKITHSNNQKEIQLESPLYFSYDKGSYIGNYKNTIYFVGDTHRTFNNNEILYGLYLNESEKSEEITDFISDMKILLGENGQMIHEKTQGELQLTEINFLKIQMTFTLPYFIHGEKVSINQENNFAFREYHEYQ